MENSRNGVEDQECTIDGKLDIWLLKTGEPLPIDPGGQRLLRTGILADMLVARGHRVTWITSSFDHSKKEQRVVSGKEIKISDNYSIIILPGRSYKKNVSIARILHHQDVRKEFKKYCKTSAAPDLIHCALPLLELAETASKFGLRNDIPVILDIRDFWPDIIIDYFPPIIRSVISFATYGMRRQLQKAVRNAHAISGISDGAILWALSKTNRPKGAQDIAFPLSYRSQPIEAGTLQNAREYWDSLNIWRTDDGLIAVYFGNMSKRHELLHVIRGAQELYNAGNTKIKFVICGMGEMFPVLKEHADKLPNVLMPKWINAAQIEVLLGRASVGLAPYPSTLDYKLSVPNKVAEYFSAGLPVISSLQGDLKRLLRNEECGLTVDNGCSKGWSESLATLSENKEKIKTMSKNSRRVYQNFKAENIYSSLCDYLEDIGQRSLNEL